VLRRKDRWPCFEASATRFGLMGFRAKGFHEKASETGDQPRKRMKDDDDSADSSDDDDSGSLSKPKFPEFAKISRLQDNSPQFVAIAGNLVSLSGSSSMKRKEDFPAVPFPQDLPLLQVDGSYSFLETAGALLNRFYGVGMDAWSTILSIARMMLVSKGWSKPPTMEDASRILKDYAERYPGANVVVFDPTMRLMKDRIMGMSPSAQTFLGPVARTQGGLEHRLVPVSDAWTALNAAYAAYKNPGMEFAADLNIVCADGMIRNTVCSFCMFPSERILVIRAIPRS